MGAFNLAKCESVGSKGCTDCLGFDRLTGHLPAQRVDWDGTAYMAGARRVRRAGRRVVYSIFEVSR